MARKIRLAKFGFFKNGKIQGHTLENGILIVTYIDKTCSVIPVQGLQYLAEITLETTCKNGCNIGKPIYFANIICPSAEASITLLLRLSVKYEYINGDDLVFFLAEQEYESQKLYFRICEHRFEVNYQLPEIYQDFIAGKEELARLCKTWEDSGSGDKQILVYPTNLYVLQGCVNVFRSTIELDPYILYLANTPNSVDDVTPSMYKADSPVLRECFIDNEVALCIKSSILKEYIGYKRMVSFKLITKQGNSISSSSIAYEFDISDGWKGIWVDREIAARSNAGNELIEIQNSSLLIYKPKSDSSSGEEDEFSFKDHPHFDTVFARIYTTAELLPVFNNPEKTKKFIERLTKNNNYVI